MKLSPINEIAKQLEAEFVEQDGWQVVQRLGKAADTESVALCDQSHNGKIRVEGQAAGAMLGVDELAIGAGKVVEYGRIYRLRRDLFFVSVAGDGGETAVPLGKSQVRV